MRVNLLHSPNVLLSATALESVVMDGNFEEIISSGAAKFLEECTSTLSSFGSNVECVDVRPGSIIVDVQGPRAALDDVVVNLEADGLNLPSFELLLVKGVAKLVCNFHLLSCVFHLFWYFCM